MRQIALISVTALSLLAVFFGCSDKLTFPDLPAPQFTGFDTTYVQISPVWTIAGDVPYARPHGIHIGYDRFIYVCDSDNHRIVKLDLQGNMIESYPIVHPVAVTQDRALDLLAVSGDYYTIEIIDDSTSDTTWYGNAVYRRSYLGGGDFEAVFADSNEVEIWISPYLTIYVMPEYWGIAASTEPSKDYYLADYWRDRILKLSATNDPGGAPFVPSGLGLGLTEAPWTLYTYEIVGQTYLAYAQAAGNLSVQVLSLPAGKPIYADTARGLPELVRLNASGAKWVAVDEFSNYYVLLRRLSPLTGYNKHIRKYNRYGNFVLEFGDDGSGEKEFSDPSGLAYKDGILYVADTGNNRIVRFQLTTEVRE